MLKVDPLSVPQRKSNIFQEYMCAFKNPIYRLCMSETCKHPALCCQNDDCKCNLLHEQCPQIRCKNLFDKLNAKIIDYNPILKKVTDLFDNLIDQISQLLEESQKLIKKYGLRKAEVDLFNYFEENRVNSLTGKTVSEANKFSSIPYDGDINQVGVLIDKTWNEVGHLFLTPLFSIRDIIQTPITVKNYNVSVGKQLADQMVGKVKNNNRYGGEVDVKIPDYRQYLFKKMQKQSPEKKQPYSGVFADVAFNLGKTENRSTHERPGSLFLSNQQAPQKYGLVGLFKQQPLFVQPPKAQTEPVKAQKPENELQSLFQNSLFQNLLKSNNPVPDKQPPLDSNPGRFSSQNLLSDVTSVDIDIDIDQPQHENLDTKENKEIYESAKYLIELLQCDTITCVQFIVKKGYNNGKLLDKESLLNLFLESST